MDDKRTFSGCKGFAVRFRRALGLLCLPWLVTGLVSCRLFSSPGPSGIGGTTVGPALEKIWEAHGGLEAWRRHGRVRARLVVEGDPPGRTTEKSIQFCMEDWHRMTVRDVRGERDFDLGNNVLHVDVRSSLSVKDYHLRSARFFFHLPFALSHPGWEFKIDVIGGSKTMPGYFWAIPESMPSPHMGYYVKVNPETGLLDHVVYQVKHPRFASRIFMVEFADYRWINGIYTASKLIHREAGASKVERRAVPAPASTGGKNLRPAMARWTMNFEEIVFEEGGCREEEAAGGENGDSESPQSVDS